MIEYGVMSLKSSRVQTVSSYEEAERTVIYWEDVMGSIGKRKIVQRQISDWR